MDPAADYEYDFSDFRSGKTGFDHVHQPFAEQKQDQIKDFKKGFLPVILPVAVVCVLIAPANLSTALLIGATCMMLMFIGRVSGKHLLLTIGIVMIPVLILIMAAVIRHKTSEPIYCQPPTSQPIPDYLFG